MALNRRPGSLVVALLAIGCQQDSPLGDLIACGGLTCEGGLSHGDSNITGVAAIDAFFRAAIDSATGARVTANVATREIDSVAMSLGLVNGAPTSDVRSAIEEHLDAHARDVTLSVQTAACTGNTVQAIAAARACDVLSDEPVVHCQGVCRASTDCETGQVMCEGAVPECPDLCMGSCQMQDTACGGICRGTCDGECTVLDDLGACAGACDGNCTGRCETENSGVCAGTCVGTCSSPSPDGSCEPGLLASCTTEDAAGVPCSGGCEGDLLGPEVVEVCQPTVTAGVRAKAHCSRPAVSLTWQWAEAVEDDEVAQAAFTAWVHGFETRIAALMAAERKANLVSQSLTELIDAARGPVRDHAEELEGAADFAVAFKVGTCGIPEIDHAVFLMEDAGSELEDARADVEQIVGLLSG